ATGTIPEYSILKAPSAGAESVRSLTFASALRPESVEARRLGALGWTPELLPDGRVRYTNPRLGAADRTAPGAPPSPEAAPPFASSGPAPEAAVPPGAGAPTELPPVGAIAGGAEPPTPATTEISQSVLRMTPGDPQFQAKLVQEAPDLVARYDTAKTATEELLAQTGAQDLRTLLKHEDPAVTEQAKKILNDMGGADPSKLPEQEVLNNAWTRDYMLSKGIKFEDPTWQQKAASEVMQYWRQQALFAPAFFVRNQVDAMTRMLIYTGRLGLEHPLNPLGWNPQAKGVGKVLGGAADEDSFWQIWKRAATRSGQEIPDATSWQSGRGILAGEIHGATPSPGVLGGMAMSDLQARKGFERWGLGVGRAFRTFRELYTAQEQAMREAGYWYAYEDAIPQALPKLTADLNEILGANGAPVLETLDATKGYMSPRGFSTELNAVNVSAEAKAAAESAFGAYKTALDEAGTSFTNKLFINYKDTTKADEFLRNFLGFHVFATRSIPFYLETLATHPGLLRGVQMFQQEQKDKAKREGTTKNKRLQNAVD
ncbi:MAG TPA: hypothetical protein VN914_00415, partial [Polyangia bacterium]|nr:hypothetical protein [Polyangia bacterium]